MVRARATSAGGCLEDYCFDAQQAAEKAIKAVFVLRGERFPLIHDLEDLLQRLEGNGVKVPKYLWEADELSLFAVQTRYPGMSDPVMPREYRRAVRIATAVLGWAERQVAKGGAKPKK
jgi:HEPN domain-containing protein